MEAVESFRYLGVYVQFSRHYFPQDHNVLIFAAAITWDLKLPIDESVAL
jgi:hypothetical protein